MKPVTRKNALIVKNFQNHEKEKEEEKEEKENRATARSIIAMFK